MSSKYYFAQYAYLHSTALFLIVFCENIGHAYFAPLQRLARVRDAFLKGQDFRLVQLIDEKTRKE